MGRARPIQDLDTQALTWGLLQALRGIVYREFWVGWVRLVSGEDYKCPERGCCMLLGCSRVAMKGPTLVLHNNWGVRQLSCMTSQGLLVGVASSCLFNIIAYTPKDSINTPLFLINYTAIPKLSVSVQVCRKTCLKWTVAQTMYFHKCPWLSFTNYVICWISTQDHGNYTSCTFRLWFN